MKQKDLIQAIGQETGFDSHSTEEMTAALADCIRDILSNGNSLSIQGFGTFEVRKKEGRLSVHPVTKARFIVPPKSVPVFRPGITLKEKIKSYKADGK